MVCAVVNVGLTDKRTGQYNILYKSLIYTCREYKFWILNVTPSHFLLRIILLIQPRLLLPFSDKKYYTDCLLQIVKEPDFISVFITCINRINNIYFSAVFLNVLNKYNWIKYNAGARKLQSQCTCLLLIGQKSRPWDKELFTFLLHCIFIVFSSHCSQYLSSHNLICLTCTDEGHAVCAEVCV